LQTKPDEPNWYERVYPSQSIADSEEDDNESEETEITDVSDDVPATFIDKILHPSLKIRQDIINHGWSHDPKEIQRLSRRYGGYAPLAAPIQAGESGSTSDPSDFFIQGYDRGAPVICVHTP
jgi:hypothetical protein